MKVFYSNNSQIQHFLKWWSPCSTHERREQVNLPIFKNFLVKKQIQFTFRLFHSWSLRPDNYFFLGIILSKYMRKLYSDNYQTIDVFEISVVCFNKPNWLCSKERIEFFRVWPRLTFSLVVFDQVLYLCQCLRVIILKDFLFLYKNVWTNFVDNDVIFIFVIWNIKALRYKIKYCLFVCL